MEACFSQFWRGSELCLLSSSEMPAELSYMSNAIGGIARARESKAALSKAKSR